MERNLVINFIDKLSCCAEEIEILLKMLETDYSKAIAALKPLIEETQSYKEISSAFLCTCIMLEKGYSVEDIIFCVRPEFSYREMAGMKLGLDSSKFSKKQLEKYSGICDVGMNQVLIGLENGLTEGQISLYKRGFGLLETITIREGLEKGLSKKQVKIYANPKFKLEQMNEIREGLEKGLTEKQIALYAKSDFRADQMAQIRLGFEGELSNDKVEFYANPKYSEWKMRMIRETFMEGLSIKQIEPYVKPEYSPHFIWFITECLVIGLNKENLDICFKFPKESINEDESLRWIFNEIVQGLINKIITMKEVEAFIRLPIKQIKEYFHCIKEGFSKEQIEFLLKPGFYIDNLKAHVWFMLKKGISPKEIEERATNSIVSEFNNPQKELLKALTN
ncbi:MAG: hypothetical protein IJN50_02345 [Clostridia bacterium]|nr:hypothetical protein [Clostridia bacterium]